MYLERTELHGQVLPLPVSHPGQTYCLSFLTSKVRGWQCPPHMVIVTHETKYSWPWTKWVWTVWVYLHTKFFPSKFLYFPSTVGSPRMWRTNCLHLSAPACTGDFSICGFWHPWVFLEQMPCRYWRTSKFGGNQKLYEDFQLCGQTAPLIHMLLKGQL